MLIFLALAWTAMLLAIAAMLVALARRAFRLAAVVDSHHAPPVFGMALRRAGGFAACAVSLLATASAAPWILEYPWGPVLLTVTASCTAGSGAVFFAYFVAAADKVLHWTDDRFKSPSERKIMALAEDWYRHDNTRAHHPLVATA